jgi:hypothetical protein
MSCYLQYTWALGKGVMVSCLLFLFLFFFLHTGVCTITLGGVFLVPFVPFVTEQGCGHVRPWGWWGFLEFFVVPFVVALLPGLGGAYHHHIMFHFLLVRIIGFIIHVRPCICWFSLPAWGYLCKLLAGGAGDIGIGGTEGFA